MSIKETFHLQSSSPSIAVSLQEPHFSFRSSFAAQCSSLTAFFLRRSTSILTTLAYQLSFRISRCFLPSSFSRSLIKLVRAAPLLNQASRVCVPLSLGTIKQKADCCDSLTSLFPASTHTTRCHTAIFHAGKMGVRVSIATQSASSSVSLLSASSFFTHWTRWISEFTTRHGKRITTTLTGPRVGRTADSARPRTPSASL